MNVYNGGLSLLVTFYTPAWLFLIKWIFLNEINCVRNEDGIRIF